MGQASLETLGPPPWALSVPSDADVAGGPLPRMSLVNEKTLLPWFCCQVPGLITFSMICMLIIAAVVSPWFYVVVTLVLTIYIMMWMANMSIFTMVGAYLMRRDSAIDWQEKFVKLRDQDPEELDACHFVIIPNYKEDENMLEETLINLGRSPMALENVHVILGMELREGPEARLKAERLIDATRHLFAGISASFHPTGIAGEIPGKASNEQWAFRKVMKDYDTELKRTFDVSRVFVTVIDADTIIHPQYFSSLAYHGLTMNKEERVWKIWQAPVLLFRNFFSVPGLVRLSGLATLLFEVSGLANQYFGSHIAFSCYSMTLALASHRMVDGWDADVIAEDHHMFVKCYFAPLWNAALTPQPPGIGPRQIVPKVGLQPLYVPALTYMVESPCQDYWLTMKDRFTQARRHCQGVAELSYCLLQYIRLCMAVGFFELPAVTHRGIMCIMWKMFTVHIINSVQATAVCIATLVMVPVLGMRIWEEGVFSMLTGSAGLIYSFASKFASGDAIWYFTVVGLGPGHLLLASGAVAMCIPVMDVLEGRYDKAQRGFVRDNPAKPFLSRCQRLKLIAQNAFEVVTMTEGTSLLFGMIPELMAMWTLMSGGSFEYLVAGKPATQPGHAATTAREQWWQDAPQCLAGGPAGCPEKAERAQARPAEADKEQDD